MLVAVAVTLVTGVDYVVRAVEQQLRPDGEDVDPHERLARRPAARSSTARTT